jgi:membrane-associated progesterone receptor component
MADHAGSSGSSEHAGQFEPKAPVQLDPPKDDPIAVEHLSKCDGTVYSDTPA